jgi:hypothetical protein
MTFEEFEKATPDDLRVEAKQCFDRGNENPSWGGGPTLLVQAQFYMQELDRREEQTGAAVCGSSRTVNQARNRPSFLPGLRRGRLRR